MGAKLDAVMKDINKKAKSDILVKGLSDYEDYERIPFTSPRMNYCTFGGLPVGKLIEFYGEEHGGKTTSALDIVANFQLLELSKSSQDANYVDRQVLYCDIENSLDTLWAKKLGVDVDNMLLLKPEAQSAEEVFDDIIKVVETGEVGLVVIDSLGAMVSQQAFDKDMTEKTYAGISGALTTFAQKAEMLCQKYKCTMIGINQVRDDMNSSWGGLKTPGGRAWKHLCMVRLQFSRGKFFDEDGKDLTRSAETPAGNFVNMSITKIKSCPPTRRTGFYTLRYDSGIDYLNDLIEVALKFGIIRQSGAWFTVVGSDGEEISDTVQGQPKMYRLLADDKNLRQTVEKLVDNSIK